MTTKQRVLTKFPLLEKLSETADLPNNKTKPRSLRPMRSMVAVRSLKPKTQGTAFIKTNEFEERA